MNSPIKNNLGTVIFASIAAESEISKDSENKLSHSILEYKVLFTSIFNKIHS